MCYKYFLSAFGQLHFLIKGYLFLAEVVLKIFQGVPIANMLFLLQMIVACCMFSKKCLPIPKLHIPLFSMSSMITWHLFKFRIHFILNCFVYLRYQPRYTHTHTHYYLTLHVQINFWIVLNFLFLPNSHYYCNIVIQDIFFTWQFFKIVWLFQILPLHTF